MVRAYSERETGGASKHSTAMPLVRSWMLEARRIERFGKSRGNFARKGFERMNKNFGDFQGYSVLSAKETTVTMAELTAKKMQGTRLQESILRLFVRPNSRKTVLC